jgi:hypothetical protein
MAPLLEGKSIGCDQKNNAKRRAHDLENQESGYSLPTQGFNLLQISPNWFLGNWTMDLLSKASLRFMALGKH